MTAELAQRIFWLGAPTAPHVAYAVTYDVYGQGWLHFRCAGCDDYSKKHCTDPQNRLAHWVGWYAAMHTGCGR